MLTFPYTQVRGYTRGQLMRAVGTKIRGRLLARMNKLNINTAGLRSFLDPPRTRGKTVKGSGKVGYVVHNRNSTKRPLTYALRIATTTYIRELLGRGHSLKLNLCTTRISTRICINGRYMHHKRTTRLPYNTFSMIHTYTRHQVPGKQSNCGIHR